jgi:predicted ATP-grasp superfamily ATP-dependent carboligase
MRILVFEYITGGGMLDCALPPSLAREGELMLGALVSDLCELQGVEVLVTRDARLGKMDPPVNCRVVDRADAFPVAWNEALQAVDAVWPIAPEHQGTLTRISDAILAAGKILLSSRPRAVRTASSKLQTARRLAARGVPVVPTFRHGETLLQTPGRWVLKPDDGVGCLDIRVCQDRDTLCREWDRLPEPLRYVAQPFVDGVAASLCLVAQGGEAALLSVNRQRIALMDDAFVLLGCVVNGISMEAGSAFQRLAGDVAAALPDLWGYAGVDLLVTPRGPKVLEVNPRLTTSYVGLKESTGINPAGLVLDLLKGKPMPRSVTPMRGAVDVCLEYDDVP